jgi:hypothetical protein
MLIVVILISVISFLLFAFFPPLADRNVRFWHRLIPCLTGHPFIRMLLSCFNVKFEVPSEVRPEEGKHVAHDQGRLSTQRITSAFSTTIIIASLLVYADWGRQLHALQTIPAVAGMPDQWTTRALLREDSWLDLPLLLICSLSGEQLLITYRQGSEPAARQVQNASRHDFQALTHDLSVQLPAENVIVTLSRCCASRVICWQGTVAFAPDVSKRDIRDPVEGNVRTDSGIPPPSWLALVFWLSILVIVLAIICFCVAAGITICCSCLTLMCCLGL